MNCKQKRSAIIFLTIVFSFPMLSQQLQLHYDLRHMVDPKQAKKNFPTLYFEYFKPAPDSSSGFIKPGSFLLKIQSEFSGDRNNTGQYYMQVSQAFRFWKPKIYLHVQYNGGFGIAEPGAYGYYLTNAFSLGAAYNFQNKENTAFFNLYASYKYTAFKKPSHDLISAFFWLWFFSNYTISFTGNIVILTENRNHGDAFTSAKTGKKFSLFGDPQIWFKVYKGLSAGSKFNIYYHLLSDDNNFKVYPSLALRYQFQ